MRILLQWKCVCWQQDSMLVIHRLADNRTSIASFWKKWIHNVSLWTFLYYGQFSWFHVKISNLIQFLFPQYGQLCNAVCGVPSLIPQICGFTVLNLVVSFTFLLFCFLLFLNFLTLLHSNLYCVNILASGNSILTVIGSLLIIVNSACRQTLQRWNHILAVKFYISNGRYVSSNS